MVNSGTPKGVPASFDCAIRSLAWDYGKHLLPAQGTFQTLYDALQLHACNASMVEEAPQVQPGRAPSKAFAAAPVPLELTIHVAPGISTSSSSFSSSYSIGDDRNAGTADKPMATLAAAVQRLRERVAVMQAPGDGKTAVVPRSILLRQGTHFLVRTIELGPMDAGLLITNAPGEQAVVSGGVKLQTAWKPSARCEAVTGGRTKGRCLETNLKGQNVSTIPGLRVGGKRAIRARYPNADPEVAMRVSGLDGWVTLKTEWTRPVKPPSPAQVVRSGPSDWPGVEWPEWPPKPMNPSWDGEGDWGHFYMG
jgi:hypothetical protein